MVIFNDKLYVSTGLNYDHGAQVWYTEDGDTWTVTKSKLDVPEPYNTHSFGNYHTNPEYKDSYKPISTSIPFPYSILCFRQRNAVCRRNRGIRREKRYQRQGQMLSYCTAYG